MTRRLLLTIFVTWLSCPQVTFSEVYLPLQVGNRWDYIRVQKVEVVQTTTGQTYVLSSNGQVLDAITLQPLLENSFADIPIASRHREEKAFPRSTSSLEIVESLTVGSNTCYRMSTGQLLRNDSAGRLLECYSTGEPETMLFDFSGITSEHKEFRFGTLQPFDHGVSGQPYRVTVEMPIATQIRSFGNAVYFGIAGGVSGWGTTFAAGVGIVRCGLGDDVGGWNGVVLIGGRVAGIELGTTGALPTSWGMIKSDTRSSESLRLGR